MKKPAPITKKLLLGMACTAAWLSGGYTYGLFAAWKMETNNRPQDAILLMLYTSLAFGTMGLVLLSFRGLARLISKAISRQNQAADKNCSSSFLGGLGGFLFAWTVLLALGDTTVAMGFQPQSSIPWLVVRIVLYLACGIALLGLTTRTLRRAVLSGKKRPLHLRLSFLVPSLLLIVSLGGLAIGLLAKNADTENSCKTKRTREIKTRDTGLRVVLVGLDGATWKVLKPLMESGSLPVMANLVKHGATATPFSPPPRASPITWTTIVTGRPPKEHGISEYLLVSIPGLSPFPFESLAHNRFILPFSFAVLGYFAVGLAEGIPPTSDRVKTKTIWRILAMENKKSLVLGLPCTWPARPLPGLILSDRFGPNEFDMFSSHQGPMPERIYPPGEEKKLKHLVLDSKEDPAPMLKVLAGFDDKSSAQLAAWHYNPIITSPMKLLTKVYDADMTFMNVLEDRFPSGQYCFAAILLNGLDLVMHAFWEFRFPKDFGMEFSPKPKWGKLIDAYHSLLDRRIGKFMKLLGPDTVVLFVSDSGMEASPHNPVWPGWHSADAMFLAVGEPIVPETQLKDMQYADIVPTILYLLGFAVPRDMKGRVLTQMIKPEFLAQHPIEFIDSYE